MTEVSALYRALLASLEREGAAKVVTEYGADGSVSKRLVSRADAQGWRHLASLEASGVTRSGPVTSVRHEDGSLTLVENYTACPRLIIIGAGHVGLALSQMGALVGFEVVVFDDRPVFASAERFPAATQVICDSFDHLFERLRIRSSDYVVVVTRGHLHDTACLRDILAGPEPAYTGMIGSRRRVAIVMNGLRGEDYNTERIARIHAPIGLSIGAVTPAEIAVSIVAEVVRVRRQGHSGSTGSVGSVGASGAIASGANGSKGGTGSDLLSCDLEVAQHLASGGRADAMITIFDSSGSVPIDSGAKLSMTYEGAICGTIGGGCSESGAMQEARRLINQGGWRVHTVDMRDSAEEDGMVCGGEMQVIIEKL